MTLPHVYQKGDMNYILQATKVKVVVWEWLRQVSSQSNIWYLATCKPRTHNMEKCSLVDAQVLQPLTFTRRWISRPFSISFTSASAVSIETVSQITSVVGCWLKCGIRELHLTIIRIFQAATVNHCRDRQQWACTGGCISTSATQSLTFTGGWIPRPFSTSFTSASAIFIAESVS